MSKMEREDKKLGKRMRKADTAYGRVARKSQRELTSMTSIDRKTKMKY